MDRRKFLRVGGSALFASQLAGIDVFAASATKSSSEGSRAVSDMDIPSADASGLRVRFLGTGAADWNGPDKRGEHRRLTSTLFDNRILIDFTPTDEDMLPQGCRPDAIFYTHSHGDHYNPGAALKIGVRRVYMSDTWYDRCKADFEKACAETGRTMPHLYPLSIGATVSTKGMTFTCLPANHATGDPDEQTVMYLVEKGAVRLLYATDTGGIVARAARIAGIDAHDPKGTPITALIMEATMGMDHDEDFRIYTHSSVGTVERIVHVLQQTGRYTPAIGQPVYLTHMARTLHGTQTELDARLPAPLKAAYDGLEVVFTAPEV